MSHSQIEYELGESHYCEHLGFGEESESTYSADASLEEGEVREDPRKLKAKVIHAKAMAELADAPHGLESYLVNCTVCCCRIFASQIDRHTHGKYHSAKTNTLVQLHPKHFLRRSCEPCRVEVDPESWMVHLGSKEHNLAIQRERRSPVPVEPFPTIHNLISNYKKYLSERRDDEIPVLSLSDSGPVPPPNYSESAMVSSAAVPVYVNKKYYNSVQGTYFSINNDPPSPFVKQNSFACKVCQIVVGSLRKWEEHLEEEEHRIAVQLANIGRT